MEESFFLLLFVKMNRRSRSLTNRFDKSCRCLLHDRWGNEDHGIKIDSSKKFKKEVINLLRSNNLLSARSNFLCVSCYNSFCDKRKIGTYKKSTNDSANIDVADVDADDNEIGDILDKLVHLLATKTFSELYKGHEQQWATVMRQIGIGLQ